MLDYERLEKEILIVIGKARSYRGLLDSAERDPIGFVDSFRRVGLRVRIAAWIVVAFLAGSAASLAIVCEVTR
jgi:hypothetical protein